MTQHYVFIMDPVDRVLVDEDTSFALMLAAQGRGHRVDHCLVQDLFLRGGHVYARTSQATMQRDARQPILLGTSNEVCLDDVDAVFIRKDPPFDAAYLYCTLLLEHLSPQKTLVLNRPEGLRRANEKLYACRFPELMPTTLVTSQKQQIKAFLDEVGGRAVIKPLDGAGGAGVMMLMAGDMNQNAIIETVTREGKQLAMVQAFLPEIATGDKRILLLNGEPLGAILRVPQQGDVRSNIHVGGRVVSATLTDADRRVIERVGPQLRADGLYFVGLDVIGGKLTEVNVTSPTGIQQMERLDQQDYSAQVITWVEGHRDSMQTA